MALSNRCKPIRAQYSNLLNVKGSLDKRIGHLKFRQWSKVAQIQKQKYFQLGVWPKYLSDMENEYSILSFEILTSMLVFLFVFTTMNGNWMAEFGAGAPTTFSRSLFRSTRFLNAICCNRNYYSLFQSLVPFYDSLLRK